ncbi:MAG: hypothetical protein K5675_09580 [Lachnospiraceae bacterium]|nr:hypothetical protein [Lachnospiraceae bacterium]
MEYLTLLQKAITESTNERTASHINGVLLPSILMDFQKMLLAAPKGQIISEVYKLDDGSMEIRLFGEKDSSTNIPTVTKVYLSNTLIFQK